VDLAVAEAWVRAAVLPAGPLELERHRPWASVYRVPLPHGQAWFKACRPIQGFEPRLTASLAARWPDRVARVLAHDPDRAWLLTADAGDELGLHGNDPALWLRTLPLYAELQRGEANHVPEHLAAGVPDRRPPVLPELFARLVGANLPLDPAEVARLAAFAPRFEALCAELAADATPASIQHDDLHLRSVYLDGSDLRILDWGDACVAHPFASLVVTFRFLEDSNGLAPGDPWFGRLRDAYLEPWGGDRRESFDRAMRVGMVAQMIAWQRHRGVMDASDRASFDVHFAEQLRRTLERAVSPAS
jgi:phosphotransferase family enzyme